MHNDRCKSMKHNTMPTRSARGFSLVELSIVLVILGLLTGGILAGQSLIRAAELRSVNTEYQRYLTAIHTFRDRYMALPGDFMNATKFWNRQFNATHCFTGSSATVTTPGTCDGNGDGSVDIFAYDVSGEELQAWRQMALAGLIEGTYVGVASSGQEVDFPVSKLPFGRWRYRNVGDLSGAVTGTVTTTFALNYGNTLELFPLNSSMNILTPAEGWNIDAKFDDGLPARGRIIARPWSDCTTAASRTDLGATYRVTNSSKACMTAFFSNL